MYLFTGDFCSKKSGIRDLCLYDLSDLSVKQLDLVSKDWTSTIKGINTGIPIEIPNYLKNRLVLNPKKKVWHPNGQSS